MKVTFRIIALMEGVSYILLLLAVPIKYVFHNEYFVKLLGMPHGVLFLFYILFAILLKRKMGWDVPTLCIIMLGSVFPFGTFYIDYKYLK